jgi:ectoine hydroxylase-related dioxygenase (phytanoyl-CoA dioxygenase family)
MELATFEEKMKRDGWVVFESFLKPAMVDRMRSDMERAYGICRSIQVKNGIAANTEGTLHHLIGLGDSFLEYLDRLESIMPHLESYFRGKFILNSFGGNILKKSGSYASAVHRDIRTFSGDLPLLLNTLVMLDDFTPENGATYLMTGSHRDCPEKPNDETFYARADRALGAAGSVLMFDSNLWHAAGVNTTPVARRSVTPMFCKPFMKQQCDYPRVVGYDRMDALTDHQRQILGYYARVPASLEEWYQPPEHRMYRPGQG